MNERELWAWRRESIARDRAFVDVLLQMEEQIKWLRARLGEAAARLQALDGQTASPPPWPRITVPKELKGMMDEEA